MIQDYVGIGKEATGKYLIMCCNSVYHKTKTATTIEEAEQERNKLLEDSKQTFTNEDIYICEIKSLKTVRTKRTKYGDPIKGTTKIQTKNLLLV